MMKTILKALQRRETPYTPVWLMRQAGRYLPEYRKLREKSGGFMNMCNTPEIASEITLQPLRRFDLDAAIIFSDILTIPHAMGMELSFHEGIGPRFAKKIATEKDLRSLKAVNVNEDLGYLANAIAITKEALDDSTSLIGFVGSPWTIACYMIEGGSPKGEFVLAKQMLYRHPELLTKLLQQLSATIVDSLRLQINSGADLVQIFDTWGGILSPADYLEFSLKPMRLIIQQLKTEFPHTPVILFSKNGGKHLNEIADSGCDGIGLDWTTNLSNARETVGKKCAVQGNLDPAILRTTPAIVEKHVQHMLEQWGPHPGHIANLGHGVTPDVPPDNVAAFVDAVHKYSSVTA